MQLGDAIPIIRCLRESLQAWRSSRQAAAGNLPAVKSLVSIFCTSPDPRSREIAGRGLTRLQRTEQIETICRESLLRDSTSLENLVTRCAYLPSSPADRALFYFCMNRTEEFRRLDPDEYFPLLSAGYAAGDMPVRARARDAADRNGTGCILARALSGREISRNAASWSYGEWECIVRGFTVGERWDDLWLLAPLAPVPLAMDAIRALRNAGWSPGGDDRQVWDTLAAGLPDRWIVPGPVGKPCDAGEGMAGQVVRLCFSSDGLLLATGSSTGRIIVRQVASSGPAREFSAGSGSVHFLAIPRGRSHLISAVDSGSIRCHDLEQGVPVWSRDDLGNPGTIAISPDGDILFVDNGTGHLSVLDTRDGRTLSSISLPPPAVTCLAVSRGGSIAVCGHADGSVSVAAPRDGRILRVLPGGGSPVHSVSPDPPGTECIVVYQQGAPVKWDLTAMEKRAVYAGHPGKAICCAVPATGGWFAIGSDDHRIRCYSADGHDPSPDIPLYCHHIVSCSATPDGKFLAAGFLDGSVRIWSMPRAVMVREYRAHRKTVMSCVSAPGSTMLATVSWDGTTKLWRIPGMEIVRTFDTRTGSIVSLAGPAGARVAVVTEEGFAQLIDGSGGSVPGAFDLFTPHVRAAALNSDGTSLAVTGADGSVRCWNTRDGSLAAAAVRRTTSHWCCAFFPDSSGLVTGGWDGTCRVFSLPGMALLRTLRGHASIVTCCAVSNDGSLLVTGSNDTTIRLWQTDCDTAYGILRKSRSEVGAVALSPCGTFLAAGSSDGIVWLYRLPYCTQSHDVPGLPGRITTLAFTGDSCFLAAGYDTGTCALFSVPGRSLVRTIPAHSGAVTGLVVLPGDTTLVSAGSDGICRFHELPRMVLPVSAGPAGIPVSWETPGTGSTIREDRGDSMDSFLRALVATRFRNEIGICPPIDTAGCYDIQIAG